MQNLFLLLLMFCFTVTNEAIHSIDGVTDNKITVNNSQNPGSLHPGLAEGSHDSWILEHLFEGLYAKDENGKTINKNAQSETISKDGLTWTIKLKPDLKWSNGDPITAYDYRDSWINVLTPEFESNYSSIMYNIVGAEAYNKNEDRDQSKQLKDKVGIKVIDDLTLEIKFNNRVPYLKELLAHYTFYPVNSKLQQSNVDWYKSAETYISNGAFVLKEWVPKKHIILVPNESYYNRNKVKLEEIKFLMIDDQVKEWELYKNGKLDFIKSPLSEVAKEQIKLKNPQFKIHNDLATYYYEINTNKKELKNKKIRQALSMTIDRKYITDEIVGTGQKPASTLSTGSILVNNGTRWDDFVGQTYLEDKEKAKKLLKEGLAEEKIKFKDFSIDILYNSSKGHEQIANSIKNMWETDLGIDVTTDSKEFQVTIDMRNSGDYEIARAGWIGDYTDPNAYLDLLHSKSDQNRSNYNNPKYDELLDKAKKEADTTKRLQYLKQAENLLAIDLPVIPIYYYSKVTVQKPQLKGVYYPMDKNPTFISSYEK